MAPSSVVDAPELLRAQRASVVAGWPRREPSRFGFSVPRHWLSDLGCNPHAGAAPSRVLDWLSGLGCSPEELVRTEQFDVAGYVGIAFPLAPPDRVLVLAKYVSLWLLWDDVHVESGASRWRLDPRVLDEPSPPASFSRFDRGWWELFRELGQRRSRGWISSLCTAMQTWDDAAASEAQMFQRFADTGELPAFNVQLELRCATIGMAPTICLLEDMHGHELPASFHGLPAVQRLKWLAGLLVGIGNDVFSLGKDLTEGHPNLASNLISKSGLSAPNAILQLIQLHDESVLELDRLAATLLGTDPHVERWIRALRFATLGFTLWESQAPRYATWKVTVGDKVIEPTIRVFPEARRFLLPPW